MGYRNTDQNRAYHRQRLRERRAFWVSKMGGKCVHCGSTSDLEFDHIDPSAKEFHISSIWSRRESVLVRELSKCQLLCSPCHKEKTAQDNGWGKHGRVNRYKEGCRCEKCREAVRLKQRRYRASLA